MAESGPVVPVKMQGRVVCDLCGDRFANKYQLGPHKRFCWNVQERRLNDTFSEFTNTSDSESEPHEEELPAPAIQSNERSNDLLFHLAQRTKDFGLERACMLHSSATYNADLTFSYIAVRSICFMFYMFSVCLPYMHVDAENLAQLRAVRFRTLYHRVLGYFSHFASRATNGSGSDFVQNL